MKSDLKVDEADDVVMERVPRAAALTRQSSLSAVLGKQTTKVHLFSPGCLSCRTSALHLRHHGRPENKTLQQSGKKTAFRGPSVPHSEHRFPAPPGCRKPVLGVCFSP